MVVKERVRRDRSHDAPDAVEADRAKAEALVVACIEDATDIQQRAKDQGDLKNEIGAVKLRLDGATRWHDMRGLKQPIKVEHRTVETQQQARARILGNIRSGSKAMTAESETKGEA